jgi:acetylornithine/N-succinyldiaminopimelate aminotransferase
MDPYQQLEYNHHFQVYRRYPITIAKGKGALVWDDKGDEYIDILGGIAVNNLGHCHPKVVKAIQEQAATLMHVSNFYYTKPQSEFVELLSKVSGLPRVFLCNSGLEAMEACVKIARKWANVKGKKGDILTLDNGFHGRSLTTIAMGKKVYQEGFEPMPEGFRKIPFEDMEALEEHITDDTIALAFEPIQGNSGINLVSREYMQKARDLCTKHDVLLIIDEVQSGVARTGKFFSYEHYGIQPDVVAAAKALAGGIPVGAVMATEEAAGVLEFGQHGTTFGGNPLVSAAGVAALKAVEEEDLCKRAEEMGNYMLYQLCEHIGALPTVKDIRGVGLMIGVELTIPARPVVERMFEKKILSNAAAGNVIRIVPPIVITKEQIDRVIQVLKESLEEAGK